MKKILKKYKILYIKGKNTKYDEFAVNMASINTKYDKVEFDINSWIIYLNILNFYKISFND